MIGRIRGELLGIDSGMAVVDCGGVGYEVLVPDSVMLRMPPIGERADLLTRQVFREDGVTLYGFLDGFQRKLFDLLLSVKGCGPRIGLALIGQLGEDAVAGAIVGQDSRALARATGVGPKLAERIILELKDKMAEETLHRRAIASVAGKLAKQEPPDELMDALIALGYKRTEVDAVAGNARDSADTVEDQLRFALRKLQK
ncbi:MAG: holliday junction helicase RuvA [Fimbriimonadaceae bacterium]|nr:holliday junction helicase RuvA [Fimbriimonadaceae bacterium]